MTMAKTIINDVSSRTSHTFKLRSIISSTSILYITFLFIILFQTSFEFVKAKSQSDLEFELRQKMDPQTRLGVARMFKVSPDQLVDDFDGGLDRIHYKSDQYVPVLPVSVPTLPPQSTIVSTTEDNIIYRPSLNTEPEGFDSNLQRRKQTGPIAIHYPIISPDSFQPPSSSNVKSLPIQPPVVEKLIPIGGNEFIQPTRYEIYRPKVGENNVKLPSFQVIQPSNMKSASFIPIRITPPRIRRIDNNTRPTPSHPSYGIFTRSPTNYQHNKAPIFIPTGNGRSTVKNWIPPYAQMSYVPPLNPTPSSEHFVRPRSIPQRPRFIQPRLNSSPAMTQNVIPVQKLLQSPIYEPRPQLVDRQIIFPNPAGYAFDYNLPLNRSPGSNFQSRPKNYPFVTQAQTSSFSPGPQFSTYVSQPQSSSFVAQPQFSTYVSQAQSSSFVPVSPISPLVTQNQKFPFVPRTQSTSFVTRQSVSPFVTTSRNSPFPPQPPKFHPIMSTQAEQSWVQNYNDRSVTSSPNLAQIYNVNTPPLNRVRPIPTYPTNQQYTNHEHPLGSLPLQNSGFNYGDRQIPQENFKATQSFRWQGLGSATDAFNGQRTPAETNQKPFYPSQNHFQEPSIQTNFRGHSTPYNVQRPTAEPFSFNPSYNNYSRNQDRLTLGTSSRIAATYQPIYPDIANAKPSTQQSTGNYVSMGGNGNSGITQPQFNNDVNNYSANINHPQLGNFKQPTFSRESVREQNQIATVSSPNPQISKTTDLSYNRGPVPFYSQAEVDSHYRRMLEHTETAKDSEFENDAQLLQWYLSRAKQVLRARGRQASESDPSNNQHTPNPNANDHINYNNPNNIEFQPNNG